jgi:hypothetical protein
MLTLKRFCPPAIDAFGYGGPRSASAAYGRLSLYAISVGKRDGDRSELRHTLDLPSEIQASIQLSEQ